MRNISDVEFISLGYTDDDSDYWGIPIDNSMQVALNEIYDTLYKQIQPKKCYFCKQKIDKACKSHFVPAFCLRNIADGGKVCYSNMFVHMPYSATMGGTKNSGLFYLLCCDCDNHIFNLYECPDSYDELPKARVLSQIAMKNYLKFIYKRKMEIAAYSVIPLINDLAYKESDYLRRGAIIDLQEYDKHFRYAKCAAKKNIAAYNLFYFSKLTYKIPIAFQSPLALLFDFNGNIINNVYSTSLHNKLLGIHICAFPLQNSSVVMMFVDKRSDRYSNFIKQFNSYDEDVKLAIINYIIFLYSEDFFMSPKVAAILKENKKFKKIVGQITKFIAPTHIIDGRPKIMYAKNAFNLNNWNIIPNLLSAAYQI